jgi:hypothetical protein
MMLRRELPGQPAAFWRDDASLRDWSLRLFRCRWIACCMKGLGFGAGSGYIRNGSSLQQSRRAINATQSLSIHSLRRAGVEQVAVLVGCGYPCPRADDR